MKLQPEQRVAADLAEKRALSALSKNPVPASCVADRIWPGHDMKPQGAGAAASRILKRLEKQGRARWTCNSFNWGWVAS